MTAQRDPVDEKLLQEGTTTVEWLPPELAGLRARRLVRRPFEATAALLRRRPDELVWLAYGKNEDSTNVIDIVVHPLLRFVRVPVQVETFTPPDDHHGSLIGIRWTPKRYGSFLPAMDAEFLVRPHGPESSELELHGQYRPPLGFVGIFIDRLLGRFVAATTAKTFLDLVARAIEIAHPA